MSTDDVVRRELIARAYGHGFAAGAAFVAFGKQGRVVVEPATHDHWRKGYDDGKLFTQTMIDKYKRGVTDGEKKA